MDKLGLKNLTSTTSLLYFVVLWYVFNVEVSFHVCSFYHQFGQLLTSSPYRSNQIEIQLGLQVVIPLWNLPIVIVPSYPNIIPWNSDSNMGIEGNRGEFLGFSNPTGSPFPSQEGYGYFATSDSMQLYLWPSLAYQWIQSFNRGMRARAARTF
jgi:hypothetical protein